MSKKVIAAIDIGSHAVRMKIGEISSSGEFKELENFRKIAVLGHDTFTKGKLGFETVDTICDLLLLFKKSFNDYGVERYEAKATSAIREATNRDYIVDQIKLKTGLNINVIDNSEEQFLTHKAVKAALPNYNQLIEEGAVIVVVGAGSIQITTYKEGRLQSSQNVKMGALRISEAFEELEDSTINYHKIVDEYITTNFEGVDCFKQNETYQHLIAVGGEIGIISRMIESVYGEDVEELSKKKFNKLLKNVMQLSNQEIEETFNIKRERADIIVPSMMLFKKFLEMVKSNTIITPKISLTDGIIRSIYDDLYKKTLTEENMQDIITNAEVVARKFHFNETHSMKVLELSMIIFDRTKRLHGLVEDRILLQVAAILHDIGKIISLDDHSLRSYDIIRSLEIFGLSKEKMEKIALISGYHSMQKPSGSDTKFEQLSRRDKAQVAKLIAIIRLADALDRSHKSKISIATIRMKDKKLIIQGVTNVNVDTTLEEWTFRKKADFFAEVFGIEPILKIKREFL